MNLFHKTAVVTGASSGLGKAVVDQMVKGGYQVFALARNIKTVRFAHNVVAVPCNIRDLKDLDEAFARIDRETDHIDVLVNCAGRGLMKPFEETTREEIMDVFGVNLKGNIYVALEVYKRMLPKKSGNIVNVGSTSSLKARELEVIYCASKWGLRGFTQSLRLAGEKHGIRVTGVYPGGMKSKNFWKVAPQIDISTFHKPEDIAKQLVEIVNTDPASAPAELIIERKK